MTKPPRQRSVEDRINEILAPEAEHEVVLAELDNLLRMKPNETAIGAGDEWVEWFGRVKAALYCWDSVKATSLISIESNLYSSAAASVARGYVSLLTLIHQARASLRLKLAPESIVVGHGMIHDYFDGVRKIVERAAADVFFVDRYLDADFVNRYLPYVPAGVSVRLLARDKVKVLVPAVRAFAAQHGTSIEVHSNEKIHDRFLFVDRNECVQSGASFKDGGKASGTAVIPIVDAFVPIQTLYEGYWSSGKVEL